MTFDEWWESEGTPPVMYKAPCKLAWEIATKEERNRCAKIAERQANEYSVKLEEADDEDWIAQVSYGEQTAEKIAMTIRQGA